MKKRIVWIVEASFDERPWHPTVGVGLTRRDGRSQLADWRRRNPDDRFRLWRYAALAEPPG